MKKIVQLFILISIAYLLSTCLGTTKHIITVKVTDIDTGSPVSGILVFVGNIEHSSSASQVKNVATNLEGVAKITYYAARKDAIQIRIQGSNGYNVVGESYFNYFEYQKIISLNIYVKK